MASKDMANPEQTAKPISEVRHDPAPHPHPPRLVPPLHTHPVFNPVSPTAPGLNAGVAGGDTIRRQRDRGGSEVEMSGIKPKEKGFGFARQPPVALYSGL